MNPALTAEPRSFIGGTFFGGAADACIKWKSGELQPLLVAAGAKPDSEWNGYKGDPFEFLPKCAGETSESPHHIT